MHRNLVSVLVLATLGCASGCEHTDRPITHDRGGAVAGSGAVAGGGELAGTHATSIECFGPRQLDTVRAPDAQGCACLEGDPSSCLPDRSGTVVPLICQNQHWVSSKDTRCARFQKECTGGPDWTPPSLLNSMECPICSPYNREFVSACEHKGLRCNYQGTSIGAACSCDEFAPGDLRWSCGL